MVLIEYITNFLELRHSEDVKCKVCGVPQGDPLSVLLFCVAMERLLRRLKEMNLTFLAYADNIVVFHEANVLPRAIIRLATDEAAKTGLTIRGEKCKSTLAGDSVTFLNHPVSPDPASIAPRAIAGATEALQKIEKAPITIHQKLIMMTQCVVPVVNYAPLVEITSNKADYDRFDQLIAQSFTKITNRSCDRMPGFYHEELRRVWGTLDVDTGARDPVNPGAEGSTHDGQTYLTRLITRTHQLPDRALTYCLQMCSVFTEEEKALNEKKGTIMEQARGRCPGCNQPRKLDHDIDCPRQPGPE